MVQTYVVSPLFFQEHLLFSTGKVNNKHIKMPKAQPSLKHIKYHLGITQPSLKHIKYYLGITKASQKDTKLSPELCCNKILRIKMSL